MSVHLLLALVLQLSWVAFMQGSWDLATVVSKQRGLLSICEKHALVTATNYQRIWIRLGEELLSGVENEPDIPVSMLALAADAQSKPVSGFTPWLLHICNGFKHFLVRRLRQANHTFGLAAVSVHTIYALPPVVMLAFYECLSILADCPRISDSVAPLLTSDVDSIVASGSADSAAAATTDSAAVTSPLQSASYDSSEVDRRLAHADALIAKMAVWARFNPADNLHKLQLMQAERHRAAMCSHLQRHHLAIQAQQLYEAAVQQALKTCMGLEAAVASELWGRFHLDLHVPHTAHLLLVRSRDLYNTVGAKLKVRQLHQEFPRLAAKDATLSPSVLRFTPAQSDQVTGAESNVSANSSSSSAASASSFSSSHSESSTSSSWAPANVAVTVIKPDDASTAASSDATRRMSPPVPQSQSLDALSVLKATASFSTEKDQQKLLRQLMRIVLETAGATRGVLVLENTDKEWCVELGGSVEAEVDGDTAARHSASPDAATAATILTVEGVPGVDRSEREEDDVAGPQHRSSSSEASFHIDHSDGSQSSNSTSSGGSVVHDHRSGVERTVLETALPVSIFRYVVSAGEALLLSDPAAGTASSPFAHDPYFAAHSPKAVLCMPVVRGGAVFGVLYLENDYRPDSFTSSHIQLLQLLCGQAALSIDNASLYSALSSTNESLEQQVCERTAELEDKNRLLIGAKETAEAATKAKAEFLSNSQCTRTKSTRHSLVVQSSRWSAHRMLLCCSM